MNPFRSSDVSAEAVLILLAVVAVSVLIGCLYLRTLWRAVRACAPERRVMTPGCVWLNLIPFFSVVYILFTVRWVAASLEAEHRARRADDTQDFGRASGGTMAMGNILAIAFTLLGLLIGQGLGELANICSLVAFVGLIVHWVQIAGYSRVLHNAKAIDRLRAGRRLASA